MNKRLLEPGGGQWLIELLEAFEFLAIRTSFLSSFPSIFLFPNLSEFVRRLEPKKLAEPDGWKNANPALGQHR